MSSALLAPITVAVLLVGCSRPSASPAPPLRIGLDTAPASLDPHLLNEFVTFAVLTNSYEGLTALDPLLRVRPALAEGWESPDEQTCRFRLRRGVTFLGPVRRDAQRHHHRVPTTATGAGVPRSPRSSSRWSAAPRASGAC